MKLFARIAALLCCAVLLFSCVACANTGESNVPVGMKNATAAGDDFRLFVPSVWNVNTAYGISGAYYTMSQQPSVSMVKYEVTAQMRAELEQITEPDTEAQTEADTEGESTSDEPELGLSGLRIDWFFTNRVLPTVEEMALGGSLNQIAEDTKSGVLDDANARQYHLTATVRGNKLHFNCVVAERGNAFYVFSFIAVDDLYLPLSADVQRMIDEFYFDAPYVPDNYMKDLDLNAEAPEGMRLASNNDVAYRFYVPTDWTLNRDEEIFSAYLTSDRSSVSVVPYMPDVESMSVSEFFALCEDMMKTTAGEGGYELLKTEKEIDLGGRMATAYTYTFTVGGVKYQYKQVIAAYKSMIYSLTYTALPEHFEAHLADVDRMIDAFVFR